MSKLEDIILKHGIDTDYEHSELYTGQDMKEWSKVVHKCKEEATQAIKDLMLDIVGEDYEFERPKEDYLPNQYIHLKAKNELRQQLRQKIEEL